MASLSESLDHTNVTECECQGQNGQQLAGVPRGCGIPTVMDCLCLDFGYKSKTVQIQQRAARILKHQYASHTN